MSNRLTQPMKAATCKNPEKELRFPLLVTPKLDGIRCLKVAGHALSNKFLPIRNTHIRTWIEKNLPDGVDGELMIPGVTFSEGSGLIAREHGQPKFAFNVFDYVKDELARSYQRRISDLIGMRIPFSASEHYKVNRILPIAVKNLEEFLVWEERFIEQGYEGIMARSPEGPYKCGRSTLREGWLIKYKRFVDGEATIVGFEESTTNTNAAGENAFGHAKRSSAKAGIKTTGELGSLIVRDMKTDVEFSIKFNVLKAPLMTAKAFWTNREGLMGQVIRYRYQPVGMLDAPRFPTFEGFREKWDL